MKKTAPARFVTEVNHYGSSGSKPSAIAREYEARANVLKNTKGGFIWVTDGLGWKRMGNPLRSAFNTIDHMMNIKLATEGQLEYVLNQLLI